MEKIQNLPSREYFMHKGISKSSLFQMSKSPAHYKWALENPEEPTPSLIFGTAFHAYVLEPERFEKEYVVFRKIDRRTKAGKEEWESIQSIGKNVISEEDFQMIKAMRDNIMTNKYVRFLLKGEKEVSYFWTDEFTGIDCKCRPDCRTELKNTSVIVDLKTTDNAETEAFMRSCLKYGYDLQSAYYKTGVDSIENKPHKFIFIAVEKKPPYAFNILEVDDAMLKKGYDDMRLYLGMLKECKETDDWYGYTGKDGIPNSLSLPEWLLKDYE